MKQNRPGMIQVVSPTRKPALRDTYCGECGVSLAAYASMAGARAGLCADCATEAGLG